MKPSRDIEIDNLTSLSIEQTRNNGKMIFSVQLRMDINKYLNGSHLIDRLSLAEIDPDTWYSEIEEPEYAGAAIITI